MSRDFYRALTVVALVGLAVFGFIRFQAYRHPSAPQDTTYIPKTPVITSEIRLLQTYVRINTSNPPGNETAGARLLVQKLREGGIEPELIESAPGRGNVYARLRGRRAGEGLLLLSHIDVVPADAKQWLRPPFSAEIRANMMYGRGTLDMKGITICQLEAFVALARSGKQPERDVVFLATADEEEFGPLGVAWLLQRRPDVFEGIRYALTEGGVTETIAEKITYFGIETGSKQFVEAELRSASRESIEQARIALEPYYIPRDPQRLLPEVRDYFARVAPHRKEHAALLANIDRTVAAGRFWLLDPAYRQLLQNDVVATGPIPRGSAWYARVILLNLPDENPAARLAWLQKEVAPFGVAVEPTMVMGPTGISSPDTPLFRLMASAIRAQYGPVPVGPMILPTVTTDCRYLRARGVECYGMWPYPVDVYQTRGIHGIDERIRLDWFMQGVALTRDLVREYATGS